MYVNRYFERVWRNKTRSICHDIIQGLLCNRQMAKAKFEYFTLKRGTCLATNYENQHQLIMELHKKTT